MFCTYCGKESSDYQKVCACCGAELAEERRAEFATQSVWDTTQSTTPTVASAPGRRFLKVTCILLIIFGGIAAFSSLSSLAMIDTLLFWVGGEAMRGTLILSYSLGILSGLVALAMGILGVMWCAKREKAKVLLGIGIASIALLMLSYGISVSMETWQFWDMSWTLWLLPFDLALPILFIIGAVKNRVRD